MGAAKKIADSKIIQELVPLNALSPERLRKVSEKLVIEEMRSGCYLFRKGDRDNQSVYLLEGKVNLIDGKRKVTSQVESGTDISRYAIANQQPRTLSARAATKVIIARIDSGLLDVFLSWGQSNHAEAVEINAADNEDWMTRILQSGAFIKIPPSMIQSLLMRMQKFPVKAGDVVINQGDEGDYFYTVDRGRCAVTCKEPQGGEDLWLAELSDGDSFGEESLISDTKRNATVTMLTDGRLMRLAKKDFVEFMKKPLINYVDYKKASVLVEKDAVWLDVRTADEYESGALEDSVNIPLSSLRGEITELVFNAKYIICCDTGQRSDLAAFILGHKGFDVYVLEGGHLAMLPDDPGQGDVSSPESEAGPEHPVADVIEFDPDVDSNGESAGNTASLSEEEFGAGDTGVQAGQGAENDAVGDAEAAALREQKELLEEEIRQYQSSEARLVEQLELLRGELGESGEKLGTLYAQSKSDADGQQLLRDQYTALQEDYEGQLASVRQDLENVRQEAETSRTDQQSQLEQLQQELENSGVQVAELKGAIAAANENNTALLGQSETSTNEQRKLVEQLQKEQGQSQQRVQQLQDELAAVTEEKQALDGQLQEAVTEQQRVQQLQDELAAVTEEKQALDGQLQEAVTGQQSRSDKVATELAGVQARIEDVTEKLDTEAARANALQENNSELVAKLESLQTDLDSSQQQLKAGADETNTGQQKLEQQLTELQEARQQDQQQLLTVTGERDSVALEMQALQDAHEKSRAELRQLNIELKEQKGHVENQSADMQATDEVLKKQQAEWEAERNSLSEAAATAQETIEQLREKRQQEQEDATAQKARLEEEFKEKMDKAGEQLERHEARYAEARQEQAQKVDELEAATAERDNLKDKLSAAEEEQTHLQEQVREFEEQISSLVASTEEQLQTTQGLLDAGQLHASDLEQQIQDKDAQFRNLQQEIGQKDEARVALELEVETHGKGQDEVLQALARNEEYAKQREQEYEESLRKAHEDLTRKNDNEKELQGQIDRLRKKLEQSTSELQQSRSEAQSNIEHMREDLHAERQARSEERAEMAARQRELKEQFSIVASKHEENISNQSGVIEEAKVAAREEERQHLLEAHSQADAQIERLQEELSKAHDEIAGLAREGKDRREIDHHLMEEQNQQSATTITQLESQLKQLTQERDVALDDQQGLREKMNILRGEVEVTRGLMNVDGQGQVEDPAMLREQLNETSKNVEIAVRLRAEAESARDKLAEERDVLRAQLQKLEVPGEPLHVPSLDRPETGAAAPEVERNARQDVKAPVFGKKQKVVRKPSKVIHKNDSSGRNWSGLFVGLAVAAIAVLVFWLMLDSENPLFGNIAGDDVAVVTDGMTAQVEVTDPPSEVEDNKAQTPVAASPVVKKSAPAPEVPVKAVQEEAAPVVKKPEAAGPGRSFRDKLKDGSKGPFMVELPAGSYMMGSTGNSLNFEESPRHKITLQSFSISRYEVTFAEYDRFARATGRRLPYDETWGRGNRPVINVSWNDASDYVAWLSKQTGKSYRLPTEAEWEYAVRAGTDSRHWWESYDEAVHANCYDCGSEWDGRQSASVGSFPANKFGVHDMTGNVQEWTQDCYKAGYAGAPADGSALLELYCTQQVVRGGAYSSPLNSLRSAKRGQLDQDTRLDNLGFRVVRVN
jgi:formylglycine-generating enzyme required for sulfatase activity/CRP-like cAMP-binding protein/rhodanese-related sulfurtransferase/chromosome segregation ATPase